MIDFFLQLYTQIQEKIVMDPFVAAWNLYGTENAAFCSIS